MKRIAFYLSLVLVVLVLASCKKGQKNLFILQANMSDDCPGTQI